MTTPESTKYETESNSRNYEGTGDGKTRPLSAVELETADTLVDDDDDTSGEPSYIKRDAKAEMNTRWQEVQTEFVDDPRKSVAHAHQLVSDAVQRIVDTFTQERNQLERQWSEGEDVSTEELRVCLQRYRAFFTRLLPIEGAKS